MSLFTDFTIHLEPLMSHYHVPGLAVGVIDGETEASTGLGVTSLAHPLPVNADTLFQVGSITKTVTGTLALRLVEAGQLALDEPVRRWAPELRLADEAVAERVTLRHLLTHLGGWAGDFFDDSGPGDDALARTVARLDRLPQLTPLGEVWAYNNAGFYIAGRAIEAAGGDTYENLARRLVLEPLGMANACYFAAEAILQRVVVGHLPVFAGQAGPPEVARPWGLTRAANAVGGLLASAGEMLRYARFHLGDGATPGGQRLLQPETLAAMHTPQAPAGYGEQVGLTWFIGDKQGVRTLRHGGATKGQTALLLLAPSRQFALVSLANSDRGGELHQAAAAWALAHYLGLPASDPEPVAASVEELEQYVGRYTAQLADRVLSLQGGTLWLQVEPHGGFPTPDTPPSYTPPPMRLAPIGPDRAVALDEPMQGAVLEFMRGPAGELAWLRMGGRLHRRM